MKAVLRYNADHTVNIYPDLQNKRWDKYRYLKKQKELVRKEHKQLDLDLFGCVKKTMYKKLNQLIQRENHIQSQIDELLPKYKRKNKKIDGYTLNTQSQRKVRQIMALMFDQFKEQKRQMEFYTFTVTEPNFKYNPQKHDDVVSQQFQKLLKNLKKNYGLKYVIYVAERQKGKTKMRVDYEPTNRIHYHCIFVWSGAIPRVLQINYYWLTLLEEVGFKTFNQKKLFDYHTKQHKEIREDYLQEFYNQKYGEAIKDNQITKYVCWRGMNYNYNKIRNYKNLLISNPFNQIIYHPVDVEPIKDFKKLTSYLSKYITKSDDKIYARTWGGSKILMRAEKSKLFKDIDNLMSATLESVKKCHKTGKELIKYIEFKLYPNRDNSPIYFYYNIILNNPEHSHPIFKPIRQTMLSNFNRLLAEK